MVIIIIAIIIIIIIIIARSYILQPYWALRTNFGK